MWLTMYPRHRFTGYTLDEYFFMTSDERREARYQRRKAKRAENLEKRRALVGSADDVFAFHIMYKEGKKCCNGVRWKQSVQNFELHLFSRTAKNRKKVMTGNYKPVKCVQFILVERGIPRNIEAPHINDRQVQKVLTQDVLFTLYKPGMIRANGASMKNKGLADSQMVLKKQLQKHFKRYGFSGWVILSDMHHFFPSGDHEIIKATHEKFIADPTVRGVADTVTEANGKDVGEPIGIEPSQSEMVYLPTPLDKHMTCQEHLQGHGHYMDDFCMLVPPDRDPKEVLDIFISYTKKLKLIVNEKKTHIIPFGKPFRYCKAKYIIKPTGKVIIKGSRESLPRARRKLNAMPERIAAGEATYEDVRMTYNSTHAYYDRYDDHEKVLKLNRMVYAIYGFEPTLENFRRADDKLHNRPALEDKSAGRKKTYT